MNTYPKTVSALCLVTDFSVFIFKEGCNYIYTCMKMHRT